MYTDNSEKRAIDALQTFEQVRYFFLKGSTRHQVLDGRVRIIAFSSEKEFRPYRFNGGAFAYYQQSHQRDYIVMQDIEPDHRQTAVHEYTHLVVQHLKLELPIWLNEGMADLYSSLEPEGKKAMVGRPLPGHSQVLSERPWMNWNVLFAVDQGSPYYNVPGKMQLFYAQSWALVHMLELSPAFAAGFPKFLTAVAEGSSTPDALQKIYGKTVDQIGEDVKRYVRQTTVRAAVFDVTLAKTDLDPQIADLSEFDVDLALADLLSTNQKTAAEAQSRLLTLEKQHPDNNEVELSMGYLAWQQGNTAEAARHFKLAIDRGLKDPAVIYQYVQLIQGTGPAPEKLEELLRQVLALQPDNLDARLLLASTAANAGHFATALAALTPVHTVDPEHAYDFFRIAAFVHGQLRDYSGARANAKDALSYAKTSSQHSEIEDMLSYIESAGTPHIQTASSVESTVHPTVPASTSESRPLVEHVSLPRTQGKTKSFECRQGSSYRLHIQTKSGEMIFSMPRDPRDVLVRNTPNAMTLFTCGPLSPRDVTVVYKPSVDGQSDGVIAELIY